MLQQVEYLSKLAPLYVLLSVCYYLLNPRPLQVMKQCIFFSVLNI